MRALELFGIENHAYYYQHLKENFCTYFNKHNIRGKKDKEDAIMLLDAIAYARLDLDYIIALENLRCFNEDLAKWVEENNLEQWAMAKLKKKNGIK